MLNICDLKLGFSDAENYKRRENKNLLNQIFIRDKSLEKLCEPAISFLIGDKGTGKTAYAVYMANNVLNNNKSTLSYIRETEYQKFITLKKEKHLDLSDYCSIWKVIIYLLLAEQVYKYEDGKVFFKKNKKFKALHNAIQEYYVHAFSPEISHALLFVQESKLAAEILAKYAKIEGVLKEEVTFSESRFQTNLLFIQKNMENALSSIKLKRGHVLFIDGIDIRPSSIPYADYKECIKGLANAVWEVNNDFFPGIRDSKGRLRVVLLIRPDIFCALGLQNQNTKIRDNSVLLSWDTTYREHRNSGLFSVIDQLLSYGQPSKDSLKLGDAWDYYFPFNNPNIRDSFDCPSSFISFLRFALYRPRDIVTMLTMLQERFEESSGDKSRVFRLEDFNNTIFRRNYANFLLGEVKDHLSFYYGDKDYEEFLRFFVYLNGKYKFSYSDYLHAFELHSDELIKKGGSVPKFMSTAEDFLQFLYELNVVCYIEKTEFKGTFIHWCFKERSHSNISPKIKLDKTYEIFYGMTKALNIGRKFL